MPEKKPVLDLPSQLVLGDATEPGVVVNDGVVRHHQALVDGLAPQVDDGHPGQLVADGGAAHLAVEGKHPTVFRRLPGGWGHCADKSQPSIRT